MTRIDPTVPDVTTVLAGVDRALPFTRLVTSSGPSTVWCADVVAHVRAGADPLAPWRAALRTQMERRHGVSVGAHVPAAFVLQWWCEVVATPIAYAAELGPWVVDPAPSGLGFELATGLDPHRIVVVPERVVLEVEADPDRRAERARAAYDRLVGEVAAAFAPDVKMSSLQRQGIVDDLWRNASWRARGAAGRSTGPAPQRVSCCFIYALPGMRECASCPRGSRE